LLNAEKPNPFLLFQPESGNTLSYLEKINKAFCHASCLSRFHFVPDYFARRAGPRSDTPVAG